MDGYCPHCGQDLEWMDCDQCEDGMSFHDCGEDCCACLYPENNVVCGQCGGAAGWHWCSNTLCPAKQEVNNRHSTIDRLTFVANGSNITTRRKR